MEVLRGGILEEVLRGGTLEEVAEASTEIVVSLLKQIEEIKNDEKTNEQACDMCCEWCFAVFFEPVTLGNGRSMCKKCVSKVPTEELIYGRDLGFGNCENKVLAEIVSSCAPLAYKAAKIRHESNEVFGQQDYKMAVEGYTKAIDISPREAVLWGNRAAAHMYLSSFEAAAADATQACKLLLTCGVKRAIQSPLLVKWLLRIATSLEKLEKPFETACVLSLICALHRTQKQGLPTKIISQHTACLEKLNLKTFGTLFLKSLSAKQKRKSTEEDSKEANWTFPNPKASIISLILRNLKEGFDHEALLTSGPPRLILNQSKLSAIKECLDCPLCMEVLFEPTALPCGHMLCRPCLARTLDHAFDQMPSCPMCRHSLAPMLGWLNIRARHASFASNDNWSHGGRQISITTQLSGLLLSYFAEESEASRVRYSAAEDAADQYSIPIFFCSLALPGVKTGLHIFEPRYRLMMRRCIESGQKKFGMCLSPSCEYGTILRILEFEQLPDGRSRLDCIGEERFRVLGWGEKDGYTTGQVEWFADEAEEMEDSMQLDFEEVRFGLNRMLPAEAMSQLEGMFGPMPDPNDRECDVAFVYWGASVLSALRLFPQENLYQLAFGGAFEMSPQLEWRPATDNRPFLRHSHIERFKVFKMYVGRFLASYGGRSSRSGN